MDVANIHTLPLIFANDPELKVEPDLTLALVFWALESEREKGGGLIRKKNAEKVRQVSIINHPLLILRYSNASVAFDGCSVYSARLKYGITPSFTHLLNYLTSNTWTSRPDSYSEGLARHSQEFEQAIRENWYEVPGWITDEILLHQVSELLKLSKTSESSEHALPQQIDFPDAAHSLTELNKLKSLVHAEIAPLKHIKQRLNEKSSEVLARLNRECSGIEDKYNREIVRIRPYVLENKAKYENERMNQHRQIEARFSGRLHDLHEKRDAASAKIDAYDSYSGREPAGGIDKQYSIKENAGKRIKELEKEQKGQLAAVDEKYDGLIAEEQKRIDSIEEQKEAALREPKRKITTVNNSTSRLGKAIDDLIENHETVSRFGLAFTITLPSDLEANELIVYLPTVIAEFDDGKASRTKLLTSSALKDSKGFFGGLKGLVGFKFMPLEESDESLTKFVTSAIGSSNNNETISNLAERSNLLRNANTKDLVLSGIAKMQARKWLKEKEAIEFRRTIDEHFVTSESRPVSHGPERKATTKSEAKRLPSEPQPIRFVNYQGVEKFIKIDELETARKADEDQFGQSARTLAEDLSKTDQKGSLLNLVVQAIEEFTPSRRYHNEFPYQAELQGWLKSRFPSSEIEVRRGASRPDIVIEDIAIEVKGPTDNRALETLTTKCLKYSEYYNKVIIVLFEPDFSETNFREIESGIERHFPHVRVVRKDEV